MRHLSIFIMIMFFVPCSFADEFKLHSTTFRVGPFPTSIVAADLNGDGIPEIVTANRGHLSDPSEEIPAGDELSYLTATEALNYSSIPPLKAGFGPYAIAVANIDALKAKDLVVVNFMAARNRDLTLLRNLGDNLFEPLHFSIEDEELQYLQHKDGVGKPVFTTPGFTAIVVDDFNGDDYRDAVATGWSSDVIAFFPGHIDGYFDVPITMSVKGSPRDLVVHDFDADGNLDLAVLTYRSHEIVFLKGKGDGSFEEVNRFVSRGQLPVSLEIGDMNGDGKQDLVVGHSHAEDSVVIFYQDNDFDFSVAQEILLAPDRNKIEYGIRDVHLMDIDANGKLDIALACAAIKQVVVLINTRAKEDSMPEFRREKYSFKKGRPYSLASADFNGDEKPDLAVTLWDENRVALLLHR